jgi:hypothetical protein
MGEGTQKRFHGKFFEVNELEEEEEKKKKIVRTLGGIPHRAGSVVVQERKTKTVVRTGEVTRDEIKGDEWG